MTLVGDSLVFPGSGGGATLPINLTTDVTGVLPFANGGAGGISTGAIPFGASGIFAQDASNLVWDNTNKRLGIGAALNPIVGPNLFPAAQIHIKDNFATLRVDNTSPSQQAVISARAFVAGGDAAIQSERYNQFYNSYFELRSFGNASWYSGHFSTPAALNTAWGFKTSKTGNPILNITQNGRVAIGANATVPASVCHIRGGGLLVGTSPLGGDKGGGSINADNIWIRGVQGSMRNTARATGEAAYTTTALDHIISVTITPAPRTITLGTASRTRGNAAEWVPIIVKDISGGAGTNNITIDTEDSSLIDGQASVAITVDNGAISFYSDGTNWHTL